jgi:hypothetical protein
VIGYLSLENDDRDRAKGKVISQLTGWPMNPWCVRKKEEERREKLRP